MSSSAEPSEASHRDSDLVREVQGILAARTSTTGDDELLVVWKPSSAPASNVKDGPGLRRFQEATKWKFTSAVSGMRVILPVEPDSPLADDHAVMLKMAHADKCKHSNAKSHIHTKVPSATLSSATMRQRDMQPGTATLTDDHVRDGATAGAQAAAMMIAAHAAPHVQCGAKRKWKSFPSMVAANSPLKHAASAVPFDGAALLLTP
jgi:hypothetical protein